MVSQIRILRASQYHNAFQSDYSTNPLFRVPEGITQSEHEDLMWINSSPTEIEVLLKFQAVFTTDPGNNTTAWEGTVLVVSMAGSGRTAMVVITLLFNLASI